MWPWKGPCESSHVNAYAAYSVLARVLMAECVPVCECPCVPTDVFVYVCAFSSAVNYGLLLVPVILSLPCHFKADIEVR